MQAVMSWVSAVRESVPRGQLALVSSLFVAVMIAGGLLVALKFTGNGEVYTDVRIRSLENQLVARPDDLATRRALAFAHQQAGDDRSALREYDRVLAHDANDLASLFNVGVIHLGRGDMDEGERYLLQVLELAPTHTLAALTLGDLYLERGAYDRIVEVALPPSKARPELADLHYLLGRGYAGIGNTAEARACYTRALQRVPDMAEARAALDELEADR
ncbi:MAG: tetratricopeptide repeat protein [Anaerosomatales bacterium]|nr:tetratricopeptide repeat protein [Anaerosomatales bacterium]